MADERPKFEDPAHLLATPDPEAQAAVAARIKQAMETGKRHPAKSADVAAVTRSNSRAVINLDTGDHGRMGERKYRVTVEQVADLWGKSVPTARHRINNPAEIEGLDAELLAKRLGVTLDWLRYGGENGYGLWEDAAVVAQLYAELADSDKQLVCDLIKRLTGPEAVNKVEEARRNARWAREIENHPELLEGFKATLGQIKNNYQPNFRPLLDQLNIMFQPTFTSLLDQLNTMSLDPLSKATAEYSEYANRLTAARDALMAQGMDPAEFQRMTAGELIRQAEQLQE